MPASVKQVLDIARAEIGVKEYPAKSNRVKYSEAYGMIDAWCMMFIWWLFREAGAPELFYGSNKTASCPTFARWAKARGELVTSDYEPGDIVLFSFSSKYPFQHVGICESVTMASITTIDGNTSLTSQDNGGAVMRRTRSVKTVVGAYRPAYAEEKKSDTEGPVYIVKAGDTLSGIAKTHNTTVTTLVALNGISDPNRIVVGQVLKIPPEAKTQPPDPAAGLYAADIKPASTLNIRQGPGTHYLSVGSLFCGETIQVTGQTGDWYTVKHNGKTGYCAVKYLARAQTLKGTAKLGLFIRSGPGIAHKDIGAIPYGATVTAWGLSGGWFRVKRGDVVGYAYADYLE